MCPLSFLCSTPTDGNGTSLISIETCTFPQHIWLVSFQFTLRSLGAFIIWCHWLCTWVPFVCVQWQSNQHFTITGPETTVGTCQPQHVAEGYRSLNTDHRDVGCISCNPPAKWHLLHSLTFALPGFLPKTTQASIPMTHLKSASTMVLVAF